MQRTFHPDAPAVGFDNRATDIQTQAGALDRATFAIARALEAVE